MTGDAWYRDGLRFACTQCGHCCTTEGYVWVDRREAERLADHLGLTLEQFAKRHLRTVDRRWALTDRSDGACVFWDEGCTVYPVRPGQCRTFPFWKENLASDEAWRETAQECEGIGEGRLYRRREIDELIEGRGEAVGDTPVERSARNARLEGRSLTQVETRPRMFEARPRENPMAGGSASSGSPLAAPTLETITLEAGRVDQIRKSDLCWGDWIVVRTRNSIYTLRMLDDEQFSVSGGWFDEQELSPHPVTVNGCTWGGSAIKQDIVAAPGLCLEFGNRVMTSRIRQVQVLRSEEAEAVN